MNRGGDENRRRSRVNGQRKVRRNNRTHSTFKKREQVLFFSKYVIYMYSWLKTEGIEGRKRGLLKTLFERFQQEFREWRETEGQGQKLYLDDPIQFSFNKIHLYYIRNN